MNISPDSIIFYEWGFVKLNLTIVLTWAVMLLLTILSILATRRITESENMSRWQNMMEAVVSWMMEQIREVTRRPSDPFLPFIGTLLLFIVTSNVLSVVPGFNPPTGSLSTTAALAVCVFFAVPAYGIAKLGLVSYFRNYVQPNPVMLPFNIIGEISRTLALAIRLFGNVMSGTMIAGILLAVTPLIFPVVMQLLGLLTGVVQAYIFAILATVYIGANLEAEEKKQNPQSSQQRS